MPLLGIDWVEISELFLLIALLGPNKRNKPNVNKLDTIAIEIIPAIFFIS
jgi:hypothetical protein